jgi:hypothetical protein
MPVIWRHLNLCLFRLTCCSIPKLVANRASGGIDPLQIIQQAEGDAVCGLIVAFMADQR